MPGYVCTVRCSRFIVLSILLLCFSSFSNTWANESMSPDLMQAFQKARHQVEQTEDGDYLALNPGNQQRHEFNQKGFVTTSAYRDANWQWGLELTGYGSVDNIQAVEQATRYADGQRIEYRRGNITEWYENLPIEFVNQRAGFNHEIDWDLVKQWLGKSHLWKLQTYLLSALDLFGQEIPEQIPVRLRAKLRMPSLRAAINSLALYKTFYALDRLKRLPRRLLTPSWYPTKFRELRRGKPL